MAWSSRLPPAAAEQDPADKPGDHEPLARNAYNSYLQPAAPSLVLVCAKALFLS